MGKALTKIKHPFRNFNLESRAHKIISQEKPTPAPRHKKDQLVYEEILKANPQNLEEALKKNQQLDEHLKHVFVTSKDVGEKQKENPDRPLPTDRSVVEQFEYGVKEPNKVPLGKVTLRNALRFITDYQNDGKVHTVQKISSDYLLPEATLKNILKYYKVFEIYVPVDRKTNAKFAGAPEPKILRKVETIKQLPKGVVKDGDGNTKDGEKT